MKNFTILSVAFISLIIGFVGCKKGPDDPKETQTPSKKFCLLTREIDDTFYLGYEYDSQNRLVKLSKKSGTQITSDFVSLTYNSNAQIIIKKLDIITTYTLTNGIVTSSTYNVTEFLNGFNVTSTYNTIYEHDAEGYLTKEILTTIITTNEPGVAPQVSFTGSKDYTYQSGNLITMTDRDPRRPDIIYTYDYYTDKTNNLPESYYHLLITKPNKNPVKKVVKVRVNPFNSGANTSFATDFNYEYNSDGLIKKKIEVRTFGSTTPETYITQYEYSCK